MAKTETLEKRVQQFRMMRLPGQPMGMHMGTMSLVEDLWRAHEAMREALKPFAEAAGTWAEMGDTRPVDGDGLITVADLREARAALSKARAARTED